MSTTNDTNAGFKLTDNTYDLLNKFTKYYLPAIATFYFTLATIWGLPYGEQILGTIGATELLLGVIIAASKKGYVPPSPTTSGEILIDIQEEGEDLLTVALDKPVSELRDLDNVTFQVVKNNAPQ